MQDTEGERQLRALARYHLSRYHLSRCHLSRFKRHIFRNPLGCSPHVTLVYHLRFHTLSLSHLDVSLNNPPPPPPPPPITDATSLASRGIPWLHRGNVTPSLSSSPPRPPHHWELNPPSGPSTQRPLKGLVVEASLIGNEQQEKADEISIVTAEDGPSSLPLAPPTFFLFVCLFFGVDGRTGRDGCNSVPCREPLPILHPRAPEEKM